MSRVSVIVTAYNSAPFIAAAVDSVRAQTMRDFELVAFDDGSTDNTLELLRGMAAADPRIKVVTQPNSGKPSIARNRAIKHATGDWVCFLDGDDLYHPSRLEKMCAFVDANPDVGAVFSDYIKFRGEPDANATTYLGALSFRESAKDFLTQVPPLGYRCSDAVYAFFTLDFVPIHTSTVLVKRSVLLSEDGPFREDVVIAEDTDLWLRLARATRLGFVDAPLSYYREHAGGITKNRLRVAQDGVKIHELNRTRAAAVLSPTQLRRYDRKIAESYFGLGWVSLHSGDPAAARRAYVNALKRHPRLATVAALVKTFVPRAARSRLASNGPA
jgi:glycosyltransferase involved in cell wall biosynthesis